MTVILQAVVPVGFIIVLGYIAGRRLELDSGTLSQLSVYILAPALVTDSFYRSPIGGVGIGFLLGYAIISLILYGAIVFFCRIFGLSREFRRNLFAILLCPNNGNMGLSIVAFAFGQEGLQRAIIYMIGSSILLFGILPAMLKGESFLKSINTIFRLPLIWAMLTGIGLQVTHFTLPFNLGKSIEWLGISSIPIALIILGIQLSRTTLVFNLTQFLASLVKLVVAPLLAYFVGIWLGFKGLDLQVFVLQTAMPTAVNTAVMVEEFGGDAILVSRTIILSTLLSFITIPLTILLVSPLSSSP